MCQELETNILIDLRTYLMWIKVTSIFSSKVSKSLSLIWYGVCGYRYMECSMYCMKLSKMEDKGQQHATELDALVCMAKVHQCSPNPKVGPDLGGTTL